MVRKALLVSLVLVLTLVGVLPFLPVSWFHGHHTAEAATYLISGFESGHAWAKAAGTSGTWSDDGTKFTEGSQSYKLVTAGDGTDAKARWTGISPAKDLTDRFLLIDVYIDDVANLDRLWLYAFSTTWTAGYTWKPSDAPSHWVQGNAQWLTISLSFTKADITGAPSRSSIVALQLYARDKNSTAVTINFDNLRMTDKANHGILSFTFDDGWLSQYDEAYTYMVGTYGLPATLYASYDVIGTDPTKYLEVADLTDMYDDGWQIGGHGQYNLDTVGDVDDYVSDDKDWLIANGFWDGASDFAYPGGVWSSSIIDVVDDYFDSGRTIIPYTETLPGAALYRLRVLEVANTTPVATITGAIDNAITNSDWLILVFHKIVDPDDDSIEYATADFEDVVDYADGSGIEVDTIRGVLGASAPTITVSAPTGVTGTTAALNGNLTGDGGDPCTITMYWGATNGGTDPASWANSGSPTYPSQPQSAAAFYKCINSLTTATTYWFTARASNSYGATWATPLSFKTGNVFYCDYASGNDATTATPLGWWSVAYTSGNGAQPEEAQTATGGSSGSTAKVTVCTVSSGTWAGGNAAGTLYWYGKSAAFAAETLTFSTTSATCSIAGDFTYCAWQTYTNGATAARIAPNDTIRSKHSSDPVSLGNAAWTNRSKTVTLASAQNATVDLCESIWTAVTGIISTVSSTPTAGGSGYLANDILTITTGGTDGKVKVLTVDGSGAVLTLELNQRGRSYTTGTGKATSGGTGTNCTVNITAVVAASVALDGVATDAKQGSYCTKITAPSTSVTNACYAYYNIADTDYSSYQKLSFWLKNEAAIVANNWIVCLCSDDAGATPVDSFPITAVPSTTQWLPFNIAKSGGGNLMNPAKSIALWTGSVAPTASKYVRVDDFVTAATAGLSLTSLISKNGSSEGGSEGYWPIQSIVTTTVLLDGPTNTLANLGKGYYGATNASVETFMREGIKTSLASSASATVQQSVDAGTSGNYITYVGGYDSGTNLRDGETIFDGLNGNGYGLHFNQNYTKLDYVSAYRYYINLYTNTGSYIYFDHIPMSGAATSVGVYLNGTSNTLNYLLNGNANYISVQPSLAGQTINTLVNMNSNTGYGLYTSVGSHVIGTITSACNNGSYGVCLLTGANGVSITTVTAADYNDRGVYIQGNGTTIGTIGSASNNAFGVYVNTGYGTRITTITECDGNTSYGFLWNTCYRGWVGTITSLDSNSQAIYIDTATYNYIDRITSLVGSSTYAVRINNSWGNVISNITSSGSGTAAFYCTGTGGDGNYIVDSSITQATFITGWSGGTDSRLYCKNLSGTYSGDWMFCDYGSVSSQTTTRYGSTGYAWKAAPATGRYSYNPICFTVGKLLCKNGETSTFTAWVKKDHATNVAAELLIRGGQIAGVTTNRTAVKASDTDWQQLSVSVTPTADGTVEVEFLSWYVAGASYAYCDTTYSMTTSAASAVEENSVLLNGSIVRYDEFTKFYPQVVNQPYTRGFQYRSGSGTLSLGDDFEWGADGDHVHDSGGGVTWTTGSSPPTISTDHAVSGTRSVELDAGATAQAMSTPLTAGGGYWLSLRFYKEDLCTVGCFVLHGNGTKRIRVGGTTSELIYWYDTSGIQYAGGGYHFTADAWHLMEIRSINWSAATFDIWVDGVAIATGCGMENSVNNANTIGSQTEDATAGAGHNFYVDDWRVYLYDGDAHEHGTYAWGPYSTAVTGLVEGTLYYFTAYATGAYGSVYGVEQSFLTKPDEPTGFSATSVSETEIDVAWTKGDGAGLTLVRAKLGSAPTSTTDGTEVYFDTGTSYNHVGLTGGQHWYYRAWSYVTAGGLSHYSDVSMIDSAVTGLTLSVPTVVTSGTLEEEETSAVLAGDITDDGNDPVTTRGFEYDTDSGAPYTSDWHEDGTFGEGQYVGSVTGLTEGMVYYYRAYAENGEGTGYGSEEIFLTKPDAPLGLIATPTTAILYTLDWTIGAGADATVIRGKVGSYPTDVSDGVLVYSGPLNTCTHDVAGEHWYYRAWSYVSDSGLSHYSDETAMDSCTPGGGLPAVPDAPTNFTATYTSDNLSVMLTWTLGLGSDDTLIQASLAGYPALPTDGATVYFGPTDNCTDSLDWAMIEDGGTVYYSAWGSNAGGLSVDYAKADTGGGTGMVNALILIPIIILLGGLSLIGDSKRNWLVIIIAGFGWFLFAGWCMTTSAQTWDIYFIVAVISAMIALVTFIWPLVSRPKELPPEDELSEEDKAWGGKRPKRGGKWQNQGW